MDQSFVYHSSQTGNLQQLTPQKSTHGRDWVYATKDMVISALFLSTTGGDFCCQVGRDRETNLPYICERYEGAFDERYENREGSIYILDGESFLENQTRWDEEVVSEKAQEVIKEIKVDNAKNYLLDMEKEGKLIIKRYPEKIDYIPEDDSDLLFRSINWIQRDGFRLENRIKEKFPDLLSKLIKELSSSPFETFISMVKAEYRDDVDFLFSLNLGDGVFTISERVPEAIERYIDHTMVEIYIYKKCNWYNTDNIDSTSSDDSILNRYSFNSLDRYLEQLIKEEKIKLIKYSNDIIEDNINYIKSRLNRIKGFAESKDVEKMLLEYDKGKIEKYHGEIYSELF